MFHLLLYQPLINTLIFFYKVFGNLGVAIVFLTILIRFLLIPLTLPSLKTAAKMKEVSEELEELKKRYGADKSQFAKQQIELYKKYGINPFAGCLPQIIQIIILFALYQAFAGVLRPSGEVINKLNEVLYSFLKLSPGTVINTRFLYLDLSKPDTFFIPGLTFPLPGFFLLASALAQFFSSKMMSPTVKYNKEQAEKTSSAQDDLAAAMQSQTLYLFPLMTIVIGFSFPSGLVLYWFVFSLFTVVQQYIFNRRFLINERQKN